MNYKLFKKYEAAVRGYQGPHGDPQSASLRIHRNGDLVVYCAPFEWASTAAKLVLVDTTAWKAQADIALTEAQRALNESLPAPDVLRRASRAAAFAGSACQRVISLLDHIGVHLWLGLRPSEDLFGKASDLLQMVSLCHFPVFDKGENFRLGFHPERDSMLRLQIMASRIRAKRLPSKRHISLARRRAPTYAHPPTQTK